MSFLAQIEDNEHAQTLAATLAFLDEALSGALDGDAVSSGGDASVCTQSSLDDNLEWSDESLHLVPLAPVPQQRCSPASKPRAMKRTRVETRMKIQQLQEQVEELQVRLQQLRARLPLSKPTLQAAAEEGTLIVSVQPQRKKLRTFQVSSASSTWLDQVVDQFNKLQKAQALNRKLKEAARKQVAVCKSLTTQLQKKAPLEDFDFVVKLETESALSSQKPTYPAVTPLETEAATRYNQLQMLYLQTDTRCYEIASSNDIDSAFSGSHTRQDPNLGPVFEFKVSTPVAFHFQDIGRMLWRQIVTHKEGASAGGCAEIPYLREMFPTTSVQERQMSMKLYTPIVGEVEVKGVNTWCKFDEPHRIVFTHTSAIRVVGSDLRFFESAWVILTKTSSSSSAIATEPTIVQTYTRIHVDPSPPVTSSLEENSHCDIPQASTADRDHLQEFVRKSLCNRTRAHQHQIQTFLLADGSDCVNIVRLPKSCPFAALRAH
ncbi:hypothetical protein FI667_g11704, partial [Globisporangium splendens]